MHLMGLVPQLGGVARGCQGGGKASRILTYAPGTGGDSAFGGFSGTAGGTLPTLPMSSIETSSEQPAGHNCSVCGRAFTRAR